VAVNDFSQNRSFSIELISSWDFRIDGPLTLPEDGTALYLFDLNAPAYADAQWWELLSIDEQQRAARFHFARDRQNYGATRALLRSLLGAYLQASPRELSFQYSDKGKPGLDSRHYGRRLVFNVSHSGDFALLGFSSRNAIGVDIEKIRVDFDSRAIAERFFSAREQKELSQIPADQQHRAFFRCWTRKEAFIKAIGEGLSHPLDQFDVSLNAAGPVLLATRPDASEAERWCVQAVDAGPGYAAAIAISKG
jgi:4'-phosphopantetheinyl transferase